MLYVFHPGFQLANNIVVTIIAFLIVVMTIPALILLLVRGVGMLKAMGSRAIILQRSEAEAAGVLSASLSLSVSNMRRRKLRTALTLSTITTLVVALVLLTTSTAFEFSLTEPQEMSSTSFHGIQIYNTTDRRNALLAESRPRRSRGSWRARPSSCAATTSTTATTARPKTAGSTLRPTA